jgi:hypothetical protein
LGNGPPEDLSIFLPDFSLAEGIGELIGDADDEDNESDADEDDEGDEEDGDDEFEICLIVRF